MKHCIWYTGRRVLSCDLQMIEKDGTHLEFCCIRKAWTVSCVR